MKIVYSFISFLFLISCVPQSFLRQANIEALFFIYRTDPIVSSETIQIWDSPAEFLRDNRTDLTEPQIRLMSLLEPKYFVVLLGNVDNTDNYFIDHITYFDQGTELQIHTQYFTSNDIRSKDSFLPIFIEKKQVRRLALYFNTNQIEVTNLSSTFSQTVQSNNNQ